MIQTDRHVPLLSRLALVTILAAGAAGCSSARPDADAGTGTGSAECQQCHGGMNGNAAPPRTVAGETATTAIGVGAHQAHLTLSTFTPVIACDECHVVPTDAVTHLNGDATVTFSGRAVLDGAAPTWTRSTASCATVYCHGTTLDAGGSPMPIWNAAGQQHLGCGSCHGNPPALPHTPATNCNGCHPQTVNPDGTINVAGGYHINGVIDVSGHGDFTSPAVHGPEFFTSLQSPLPAGAFQCTACHGATYDGGSGPSCNACHASAGWTASWQSNCSFCHGTASTFTKTTAYTVTASPTLAAPPDAVAQRLDPTHAPVPSRTGAHQPHLTGKASTGAVFSAPFPCATCHAVPADLGHAGGPGRAPVVLTASGALAANLGTTALGSYDPATATCATYCHGNGAAAGGTSPIWSGAALGCTGCHGNPPATGQHDFHVSAEGVTCAACHSTTASPSGGIVTGGGAHVDGAKEVVFVPGLGATWNGTAKTCTAACHVPNTPRLWN